MYKNVASQKVAVFTWDGANGCAKTGDAANITAQISKDGGASVASNDTNPTELDATDHPGVYVFDLLQAETNCDLFTLTPDSSTANIVFRPIIKHTNPITHKKYNLNSVHKRIKFVLYHEIAHYIQYEKHGSGFRDLNIKVLDMGMGHERNAWFSKNKIYDC